MADTAAMERAVAKREAFMSIISDAAQMFNMHAKDVAEAVRAHAMGTDDVTKMAKAEHYEKMVSAEVARGMALRAKAPSKVLCMAQRFHPEVITIKPEAIKKARATPSATLLKRLTTVSTSLLVSAPARQLGAHARRETREAKVHMSAMRRIERVASAAKRRALREALKAAELKGREIRSEILLAKKETSQLSILAKEAALADMVHANRLAAEEELAEKKMMDLMKQEAATEWHAAVLRRRAKKGVVAVRQSATRSRREALRQVVMKHAELHQTRRMQAETSRQAELGARVFTAAELALPLSSRFAPVE